VAKWTNRFWLVLGLSMLVVLVVLLLLWDFVFVNLIKSGTVEAP